MKLIPGVMLLSEKADLEWLLVSYKHYKISLRRQRLPSVGETEQWIAKPSKTTIHVKYCTSK